VITLHGRKAAREPFAFLTCSLISYFWAGHAVIFFCFLERLLCSRASHWNRTIGWTIRETYCHEETCCTYRFLQHPGLDKVQHLDLITLRTNEEKRGR